VKPHPNLAIRWFRRVRLAGTTGRSFLADTDTAFRYGQRAGRAVILATPLDDPKEESVCIVDRPDCVRRDRQRARPIQRWGAARFRRIFERAVKACIAAGIAKGEIVHVDASLIRADVAWESLARRHVDAVAEANAGGIAPFPKSSARPGTRYVVGLLKKCPYLEYLHPVEARREGGRMRGATGAGTAGVLRRRLAAELVPDDHILARVDRVLDCGWLHEEVSGLMRMKGGRGSIRRQRFG
jgi:hypothetical protein